MTSTPTWATLPLDQAVALRTSATRLAEDFAGIYGAETIERFLHSSFDQFASNATIPTFLPLMAERFARQCLRALAKIEGLRDDGKPAVLFLCVHNAGRSQMAMGLCSPGSVTRNGFSMPRPARAWRRSARSGTRSSAGSAPCWTNWASPPPEQHAPARPGAASARSAP